MKNFITIAFTLVVLTGCSSRWNAQTCSETNFEDLGYQQGSAGKASKMSYYNQACLKKKVQIPTSQYNNGYNKGIRVFCSPEKGRSDGATGSKMHKNCRSIKAYANSYKDGLQSFCSVEKGVQDGFSMKPETILCSSFDTYRKGYNNGKKEFCSSDKGHEDGYSGEEKDSRCVSYSAYNSGYKKGQAYYCSYENAIKIGKKGDPFPAQCKSSKNSFRINYNKGRTIFLKEVLADKETSIKFERQNYERLRDDLQDAQFELGRLPKYELDTSTPDGQRLFDEKEKVNKKIQILQGRRNSQRQLVEDLEAQIYEIKKELQSL